MLHRVSHQPVFPFDPLVKKVYLELPAPTLEDNISDIDRITRELQKVSSHEKYEISFPCLQNLTEKLRAHRLESYGYIRLSPRSGAYFAD